MQNIYRITLGQDGKVININRLGKGVLSNAYPAVTYFYTRNNTTGKIADNSIWPKQVKYYKPEKYNYNVMDVSFDKALEVAKGETLYLALA